MLEEILLEIEEKTEKTLENTRTKFSHIRAGRANVQCLME